MILEGKSLSLGQTSMEHSDFLYLLVFRGQHYLMAQLGKRTIALLDA